MRRRLQSAAIRKMDCAARLDERPCMPDYPEGCGCSANVVDAILRELMEPTEEMLRKAMGHIVGEYEQQRQMAEDRNTWQVMLQHIFNEGRDEGNENTG